ncbi:TolC family protein, partial [bacterium]|nr:TolC family protein [bacterium]
HRMILNRSDVLGLLAEYEADQSALQLEIAKQYPDINIGPGYQLDQTDNKWSIGFSLTLPVFNQNQGAIAEAEAKRKETAARFLALQNRVFSQIDQAAVAYQYAVKKVEAANKIYQALQQQEQTTKRMYEVGEVSQLAVSAVQLEVNTGAIDKLEALGNAQLALNTLENVLQRPLHTQSPRWINPEPNYRDAQEKNK